MARKKKVSGQRLRQIREEERLISQRQVAEAAEIAPYTYQRAEAGEELSLLTIGKIARALDIDPKEIIVEEEQEEQEETSRELETSLETSPLADPSTPLGRFLQGAREFREEAEEDPFSAREKLPTLASSYVFAKKYVNSLPEGEERTEARRALDRGQITRFMAINRIMHSRAGDDRHWGRLVERASEAEAQAEASEAS